MDIVNFNKKLNKITVLTESVSDSDFSPLERDLLLTYIRDLYDLALGDEPVVFKRIEKVAVQPVAPKVEVSPEILVQKTIIAEPIKPIIEPVQPTQAIKETVAPPSPQTVVVEVPTTIQDPVKPTAIIVETTAKSVPLVEKIKVATPSLNLSEHEIINELFSEGKVNDLSDKLGLTPVQDLTKSMGINERIFTQQELFNNNPQQFNDVLTTLNGFQSFEEAKQYLINKVIPQYGWMQDDKIKKATTFIKLVKRKYL